MQPCGRTAIRRRESPALGWKAWSFGDSFRSISEGRKSGVEKPKGKGTIATTSCCGGAFHPSGLLQCSEVGRQPEREHRGKFGCGNTLPRGEHEQLVPREGSGLPLGRWETFRRTSGSAKAQKVLRVKPQNANPTPPGGLAWRIRIGNGHHGGNTTTPAGADFLFLRVFQKGRLVGRKPCLSLPPDWRLRPIDNGPVAQLDRASHYGCEGLGSTDICYFECSNPHFIFDENPYCTGHDQV